MLLAQFCLCIQILCDILVYKENQKLFNLTVFTTLVRGKVKIYIICYSDCVICGKSVTI